MTNTSTEEAWWKACAKETVSERDWQAQQRQAAQGAAQQAGRDAAAAVTQGATRR